MTTPQQDSHKQSDVPKVADGACFVSTGRSNSGKDFVTVGVLGARPISIAEPIYKVVTHYLGDCDRKNPEVRRFMQLIGLWGRGLDSNIEGETACCGVAQTRLISDLRENGAQITGMPDYPWPTFGSPSSQSFWIDGAAQRALSVAKTGEKVAITNARFPDELSKLTALGFTHIHVACSENTLFKRRGYGADIRIDGDITEKMAKEMDASLRAGQPIAGIAVWNDDSCPAPSPTMIAPNQLLASLSSNHHKKDNTQDAMPDKSYPVHTPCIGAAPTL